MELTLQWLIEESELIGLKLLTCNEHLSNIISGVNIMDNPDTVRWIKPGELVLTTGYVFRENPSLQEDTIIDLKKAGCAALCIKSKRFLDEIPQPMLDVSQKEGLPLIELPPDYSLADISETVSKNLFQEQFQDAIREQTLLNTLFNCYFQGRSMGEILKILSDYTASSVFILDNNALSNWFSLSPQDAAALADDELPKLEILSSRSLKSKVCFQGSSRTAGLLPFSNSRYTLCILYDEGQEPNWNTISHALMILDFSRNNKEIRHPQVMNYYDSFFHFLMSEDNFSESYQLQLYGYYGLPQPANCICALVAAGPQSEPASLKHLANEYDKALRQYGFSESSYFIAWNKSGICICFFPVKKLDLSHCIKEFFAEDEHVCGVSRPYPVPLRQAYKEAVLMLSLSQIFQDKKQFFFQDYLIFWNISKLSEEEKHSIYRMTVKPLIDYDKENDAGLTETLTEYFLCHLNATLAASKLYIHRNTFIKRMEKIQSLIDFRPDDYNNLFSTYYGLCVYLFDKTCVQPQ